MSGAGGNTLGARRKLVFLTGEHPAGERSGAQIRDASLLRLLAEEFNLCVLFAHGEAPGPAGGVRSRKVPASARFRLARLLSPFRAYVRNGFEPGFPRALAEEWEDGAILWVSRLAHAQYLPCARRLGYRLVLDEHNVEGELLRELLAQNGGSWLERWRARELIQWESRYCAIADSLVVTSERDQERLRQLSGRTAHVVPSFTDVAKYLPPRPEKIFLFVGTLDYTPNRQGLLWLLREVFPHCASALRSRGWRFQVVGSRAEEDLKGELARAQVELVENVAQVAPYLSAAGAVIVPLLSGGGTRLKIVEAFAAQRPVLSTSKGAEGLPYLDPGENIWLADSAEAFATALLRLSEDEGLRERLGVRARELAQSRFDWRAGRPLLAQVFSEFG